MWEVVVEREWGGKVEQGRELLHSGLQHSASVKKDMQINTCRK